MSIKNATRRLLLASLLLCATSQAAEAMTVTPSGAYTASSGQVALRFSSNGQTLTCASSRIGAIVSSNGSGTVPLGSASFSGCSNALLGTFTITQLAPWTIRFLLLALSPSGFRVGIQIGKGTRSTRISNGSCSFTDGGSININKLFGGTLPKLLSTADVFTVGASSLTVDSVTGCSPLLTTVGLTATISASYTLSRSVTVSG